MMAFFLLFILARYEGAAHCTGTVLATYRGVNFDITAKYHNPSIRDFVQSFCAL